MTPQQRAQHLSYYLSSLWHIDLPIGECDGVVLGDVMEYDALRVIGGLFRKYLEREMQGDGRPAAE